jgi:hypothetical protein
VREKAGCWSGWPPSAPPGAVRENARMDLHDLTGAVVIVTGVS